MRASPPYSDSDLLAGLTLITAHYLVFFACRHGGASLRSRYGGPPRLWSWNNKLIPDV